MVVLAVAGITAFAVSSGDDTSATSSGRVAGCDASAVGTGHALTVGKAIPTFTLPTLDGRCLRLDAYRGRPIVINFWASWCNPCRREFPLFHDARASHRSDHLEIIGVTHEDIASDARHFASQRGADWPLGNDADNVVGKAFGVVGIPQTFFVAADGTLEAHLYGLTSRRQLDHEITRLLQR